MKLIEYGQTAWPHRIESPLQLMTGMQVYDADANKYWIVEDVDYELRVAKLVSADVERTTHTFTEDSTPSCTLCPDCGEAGKKGVTDEQGLS